MELASIIGSVASGGGGALMAVPGVVKNILDKK